MKKKSSNKQILQIQRFFKVFTSVWLYLVFSLGVISIPLKDLGALVLNGEFVEISYWILDGILLLCVIFVWILYVKKVKPLSKEIPLFLSLIESKIDSDEFSQK